MEKGTNECKQKPQAEKQKAKPEAEQMIEVNGGDNIEEEAIEVKPTQKEVLSTYSHIYPTEVHR